MRFYPQHFSRGSGFDPQHFVADIPRFTHYATRVAASYQELAEGLVRLGSNQLGWSEDDLGTRRKGDRDKFKLAARLRAETTMTVKWIARRLQMGTWTHVNHLLYWHRQQK